MNVYNSEIITRINTFGSYSIRSQIDFFSLHKTLDTKRIQLGLVSCVNNQNIIYYCRLPCVIYSYFDCNHYDKFDVGYNPDILYCNFDDIGRRFPHS